MAAEDWILNMGFHPSRMRNALCLMEPVEQGLAREGEEGLRNVMPREDESEKMRVLHMEGTSPTLLNLCSGCCALVSRREEVGLGCGGEGGREDAFLVRERTVDGHKQEDREGGGREHRRRGPFGFIKRPQCHNGNGMAKRLSAHLSSTTTTTTMNRKKRETSLF